MGSICFRNFGIFSCGITLAAGAWSQEAATGTPEVAARPLQYRFGQDFSSDSNVLRLTNGLAPSGAYLGKGRSDNISRTYGGISYNNNIGTQSIAIDAGLEFRKYQSYTNLDGTNYRLSANWQGDLDRAWYSSVGASISALTNDFTNQYGRDVNINRSIGFNGRLGYRLTPTWSIFSALNSNIRTNSANSLASSNVTSNGVEVGGRYEPGGALSGEFLFARRSVRFPNFQTTNQFGVALVNPVDNGYSATQVIARTSYKATGQSSFTGNVGFSSSRFNTLKQRDNTGLLFGLAYRYTYSEALTLGTNVSRDIAGEQLSFSSPVLSTRFGLDAAWRATSRVTISSAYESASRKFNADPSVVLGGSQLSSDRLETMSVNARYELLRTVNLNLGFSRSARYAAVSNIPYSGTIAMLGVAVNLD
jgi:hypothetical protein